MTNLRDIHTITADLSDNLQEISARYPTKRSAIMPALYLAQDKYGTVDEDVYKAIAQMLEVPEIWVFEVASFYTMYNRKELGKYHIQLCTNVSCMLLGSDDVLNHIQKHLDVKTGETTADGLFTLSCVECLGGCDVAPVMIINENYYNNLTNDRVTEIIASLKQNAKEAVK